MNAALQCLSHTDAFRDYFLGGSYKKHMDKRNPMASNDFGITEKFVEILNHQWVKTKEEAFSPDDLYFELGQANELYTGYE